MGTWTVEVDLSAGIVRMRLAGSLAESEMRRGFARLRDAIAKLGGASFGILSDEAALKPLSQASARVQAEAKAYCAALPGFVGSAVLVKDPITGMQSRRTSVEARIADKALVSSDTGKVERYVAALADNVRRA